MKNIRFAAVAALAVFGFAVFARLPMARAADNCGISKDDIAAIQAIQSNPNLGYLDEINQELAARKNLLSKTITCAKNDAQSLRATMAGASVSAADENIKSQLLGNIDVAIDYYNLELGKLNDSGIKETEQIAQEVLSWRASTYVQLAGRVDNFILWSENQNLFETASARMAQITPMVSFLSQTNNSDLANAFSAAQTSFAAAKNENASARSAIVQSLSSDQTLGVIKQSLQSLSDTYQNFFNVSDIIQKLLTGTSQS